MARFWMLLAAFAAFSTVLAAPATTLKNTACPILFDGRVGLTAKPADFDKNTSVYNHQYDLGQNVTWAKALSFPLVLPSLFDVLPLKKSFAIGITDESIFVPGSGGPQYGFRRAELLPGIDGNGNATDVDGKTTFHWSIRTDPTRPLNYTHEYHPVWHELADYSSSQFTITAGKPFNASFDPSVHNPRTLRVAGRQSVSPEVTFFQTPFLDDVWHNFALTLDWVGNTITVYYSQGYETLKHVAGPSPNDNSGGGAFHVGILKLPTGPLGIDVVHTGFQESGIHEGLLYGGVFIEQSTNGCVTLAPRL